MYGDSYEKTSAAAQRGNCVKREALLILHLGEWCANMREVEKGLSACTFRRAGQMPRLYVYGVAILAVKPQVPTAASTSRFSSKPLSTHRSPGIVSQYSNTDLYLKRGVACTAGKRHQTACGLQSHPSIHVIHIIHHLMAPCD